MVTSEQAGQDMNLNPTGKGGFGDHPEHRNSGGRPQNSQSFTYWYRFFKDLSVESFRAYETNHPEDKRTVAESLAYVRVFNARSDLKEFQEVADRSEGKALARTDITTDNKPLDSGLIALAEIAEALKDANRDRPPDDPHSESAGLADAEKSG